MPEHLISQKSTAIESYHSEQPLVKTINDRVFSWIRINGNVSRNEIQRSLGITSRQSSSSVWHLMKQGKIKVSGTKQDSVTKHQVETLDVNDTPEIISRKMSNAEKLQAIKELCVNNCGDLFIENDILKIINS